jgi:glycosyltransferase involved in cell wall biosynthesis
VKILLLTAEPPLPLGHVSARWFYALVNQLAKAEHEVQVLSSCSKADEIKQAQQLFSKQKNIDFHGLPTARSRGLAGKWQSFLNPGSYQFSQAYHQKFQELSDQCDLIHGEQLSTGFVAHKADGVPTLINVHNLISIDRKNEIITNVYEKLVRSRQVSSETSTLKKFKHLSAVSQELVQELGQLHPNSQRYHLPFAIDPQFYQPQSLKRPFDFGLVGNMNWRPSLSAADNMIRRIWPKIRQQRPEAKLVVAGWNAKRRLSQHLRTPGLTIKENVEDIRDVFQQMGSLIYFPDEGSGIKVKILEAMLMECSVVTNQIGLEGLSAIDGQHLLVASNLESLVEKAIDLMDNPSQQKQIAQASRQYVIDQHNPEKSYQVLQSIYQAMR